MKRDVQNTKIQTPNTNKGITLIALVITIIVLLILAGVAINMAIDSDGLFGKANEAAHKWNTAVGEEEEGINDLLNKLDEMTPKPMITKWNIAAGDEVRLYLYYSNEYIYDSEGNENLVDLENNTNVTIDWGDGTVETYTAENLIYEEGGYIEQEGYVKHTYEETNANTMLIINGKCNMIGVRGRNGTSSSSYKQLLAIESWGETDSLYYKFNGCRNLVTIASPEKNTFKNVVSFENTFKYCTSLATIPEDFFDNTPNVISFQDMFFECESLTGYAIPLWERVTTDLTNYEGNPNGRGCYALCEGLEDYDAIPEYWRYYMLEE